MNRTEILIIISLIAIGILNVCLIGLVIIRIKGMINKCTKANIKQ